MSLVNQMLRDLDARQASSAERQYLADMPSVAPAVPPRRRRLGVALGLAGAVLVLGLYGWARPPSVDPTEAAPPSEAVAEPAPAAVSDAPSPAPGVEPEPEPAATLQAPRLLQVLPGNDGRQLSLQLLLDRPVGYLRSDTTEAITLRLQGVDYAGPPLSGGVESEGARLAWQVEAVPGEVRLRLTGSLAAYAVQDRLEAAGEQWQLWLQALPAEDGDSDETLAEAGVEDEASPPAWMTRPVPAAEPSVPVVAAKPVTLAPVEARAPEASLRITSRTVDPLDEARRALAEGREVEAIAALQALHQARPDDREVVLWLARAYLAAGDLTYLQAWLPPRIPAGTEASELRLVLARAQLGDGRPQAAIATLQTTPPPPAAAPDYHALLAALYQQVGDWQASAASYRRLLEVRGEGTWHLGLAIALDQLGERAQAAEQFGLALRASGLDETTRRYARERLGALGEP